MKILIGLILILLGAFLIYIKIKKKILVEEERDYFYIPPHIIKFWGISIGMILCGIILISQGINE